jgi:hypothetical protein
MAQVPAPGPERIAWLLKQQSDYDILIEIQQERTRQDQKWGEQNHPDGTGPDEILLGMSSYDYEYLTKMAKEATDTHAAEGTCTFADILLEEVFEALAEKDQDKLRKELIQVAAVAAQWAQKIDRDKAKQ